MTRLLLAPAVVGVIGGAAVVEIWRRGFAAPVVFGVKLWTSAVINRPRIRPETEADPI